MVKVDNQLLIDKFIKKHNTAKSHLLNWLYFTQNANWNNIDDIRNDNRTIRTNFPGNKPENKNRVVFKLGLHLRIDTFYIIRKDSGDKKIVIIRIGTHEEYNKWKY